MHKCWYVNIFSHMYAIVPCLEGPHKYPSSLRISICENLIGGTRPPSNAVDFTGVSCIFNVSLDKRTDFAIAYNVKNMQKNQDNFIHRDNSRPVTVATS